MKYAVELYNQAMTNEVLSWDDTGNNLLLASGTAAWIQNPISALRTIEKDIPDLAKNIYISNTPAGPKGRFTPVSVNAFGVARWASSVPAAKAFVTDYFAVVSEGIKASQGYNQPLLKDLRKKPMPILGEESKLTVLQDFDQVAKATGHPGPPTPPPAKSSPTGSSPSWSAAPSRTATSKAQWSGPRSGWRTSTRNTPKRLLAAIAR